MRNLRTSCNQMLAKRPSRSATDIQALSQAINALCNQIDGLIKDIYATVVSWVHLGANLSASYEQFPGFENFFVN